MKIDGISPLDKPMDLAKYPLVVQIGFTSLSVLPRPQSLRKLRR